MARAKKADAIAKEIIEKAESPLVGRPTKYEARFCNEFKEYSKQGMSKEEICLEWEISHQTLYDWQDKHPEFLEAVKIGTQFSKGWWMKQGRENLSSSKEFPFQPVLWSMNMRCRFGMTEDHLPHVQKFKEAKTIKEKAEALTEALSKGEIAPSQANLALDAVTKEANLIEKSDLIKRVEALEDSKK